MKLAKYTLFSFLILLLSFQSYAQPDMRRMNISIGIFTPSATSYDYEGAIGVIGSTGYTVDDIEPGDMFWDDLSRYRVDSVEVTVAGSVATVWIADIYGSGAPQSGRGTLGKPTTKLGLQPLTENGSNFITEAQEAKILTFNLNRMDSLAGDGNGIISALPEDRVDIESTHSLLMRMDTFNVDADVQLFRANGGIPWLEINDNTITAKIGDVDGNYEGYVLELNNNTGSMFLGDASEFSIDADDVDVIFSDNANGVELLNYDINTAILKFGDASSGVYGGHLMFNINTGDWGIGDMEDADSGQKIAFEQSTGELLIGSDNYHQIYIDEGGFRLIENSNGYGTVFTSDSNNSTIRIGDVGQESHGHYMSISLDEEDWGIGDLSHIGSEIMLIHDSGARQIRLGEMSGFSEEQLVIDYSNGTTSLGDVNGQTTGMHLSIDNSNLGVITLGDKNDLGNGTQIEIDAGDEEVTFGSTTTTYSYTFPTTSPGANQVLGEGPTDDNKLVWVDPASGADGNGLISALPAAPVTIDANGNALIIDSTGTTKITAVGTATGTMVVSGASSLPNTFSHIEGADTAQVNVRAASGISLYTTQSLNITSGGGVYAMPQTTPEAGQVAADQDGDGNLEFVYLDALDTLWLGTATYAGSAALDVGITDVKIAGMSVGIQEGFTVVDSTLTYLGSPGYITFSYNGTAELSPTIVGTYLIAFKPYQNSSPITHGRSEIQIEVAGSEQWFQPFGNTVTVFANTGDVFSVRYSGTAGLPANLRNISITAHKL